jgi:hypothetical protein
MENLSSKKIWIWFFDFAYLGDDILVDPLAELGLKVKRGYDTTADIRKIRKETNRLKKEGYLVWFLIVEIKRRASTRQNEVFSTPNR